MQSNEFYRGVLAEVKVKKAEIKPPAPNPSVTPASSFSSPPPISQVHHNAPPVSAPAMPSPVPMANNVGGSATEPVVAAPAKPRWTGVNPALTKAFIPAIQKSYAQFPVKEWPSRMKQDSEALSSVSNVLNMNSDQLKSNPFLTGAYDYMKSNPWHPIQGYKDLQAFKSTFADVDKMAPEDLIHQVHEWGKTDPTVGKFYDDTTHQAVREGVQGFNSLEDVYNAATGKAKDPLFDAAVKEDPSLKDYATSQTMSRGGQLLGGWLKDNWGKVAAGVGGVGALAYILKNMLSDDEEEKPQPQQRAQPNAPRFL